MRRISTVLTACLVAVAIVGCGTASAASQPAQTPTASHGVTGHPAASAGCVRALTITNAGNGKTYCVKVGTKLTVILRGTDADMWQEPHASGHVLVATPNGAFSLVAGLTGASYRAVRPGRAVITSVRAPDYHFRTVIIVVSLRTGPGPPARSGRNVPW